MARVLLDEDRISQSLDSFNRFLADMKLNFLEVKHVVDDMPGISAPFSRKRDAHGGRRQHLHSKAAASRLATLPEPDLVCCRLLTLRYISVPVPGIEDECSASPAIDAVLSREAFGPSRSLEQHSLGTAIVRGRSTLSIC